MLIIINNNVIIPDKPHSGVLKCVEAKKKLARMRHGELQPPRLRHSRLHIAHVCIDDIAWGQKSTHTHRIYITSLESLMLQF